MNIILSGPDACGKTTLSEKLQKKYGMSVIHSTASTPNTLAYHLDLIDYHDNTIFDRWSVGEMIFPKIYGREPKMTEEEFYISLRRVEDNNDMYIIFTCSDTNILKERLIERGEDNYLAEIMQQCGLYSEVAHKMSQFFKSYANFYIIDIAKPNAYDELDNWIDQHFGKTTPNVVYKKLAKDLVEKATPIDSSNPRGSTKELHNYMFTIDDIDTNECITLKTGKTNITYTAAELLWYWSSRNDLEFISKFSKFWDKVSDDGKTANSAYGYILQQKHGFNQIEKIIELLKKDPNSRRAVLNINVPNERVIETHDEPCTVCLNYQIRDGKLHSTNVMRSNDFNFGLRNDLPFFIYLQKYIANRLGVGYGSYTHLAFSMHMYDRDYAMAKNIAYGTSETTNERLNVELLITYKDVLCDWVDNHFTSKEDFEKILKEKYIIYTQE